ncbi:hypothetical protein [Lacticaseibacillus yichunensis]|uniref:Uncharacterized protein n=1 Tax=Lacticaseibacillus yichunensis TaxID=2486015 RepID=A0ABW4CN37_9LACO|nr:hypothetical protein [Lacticaseibacillus yichunensis]
MKNNGLLAGVLFFAQATLFPILNSGLPLTQFSWRLAALVAMALALSFTQSAFFPRAMLIAAAVLGLLGCIGQWQLLPLVITQLGFSLLLNFQQLNVRVQLSGWFIQVIFLQLLLTIAVVQVLPAAFLTGLLLDIALLTLPALLTLWADRLPGWSDVVLLVAMAGGGFLLQRLTLVTAAALLILTALLNPRIAKKASSHPALYAALATIQGLLMTLTRLHG